MPAGVVPPGIPPMLRAGTCSMVQPKLPKKANSASVNLFDWSLWLLYKGSSPGRIGQALKWQQITGNWKCPEWMSFTSSLTPLGSVSLAKKLRHTPNDCRFGRPHSGASKDSWQLLAAAYSLHALKTLKTLKALPERCMAVLRPLRPRSQNKSHDGARAEVRASLGGSASPGALTCHPGWPPQQGKVTNSHGSESYDVLELLNCL